MPRGAILLVDDEDKIRKMLGQALRTEGHEVLEASGAREAQRLLGERSVDVLVVDNLMPEMTGLELIRELVSTTPESDRPQLLMTTAHATIESAIEAMKLGALDFLQKPFEIDELLVVVRRALDHQLLRTQHRYLLSERDFFTTINDYYFLYDLNLVKVAKKPEELAGARGFVMSHEQGAVAHPREQAGVREHGRLRDVTSERCQGRGADRVQPVEPETADCDTFQRS